VKHLHFVKLLWDKAHPAHGNKETGNRILEYFQSLSTDDLITSYTHPKQLRLEEQPSQSDLWEDLKYHSNQQYTHGLTDASCALVSLDQFRQGWDAMGDHANPLLDHNTPYTTMDVFSKKGRGLYRCIGNTLPEILQGEDVIVTSDQQGHPLLSSIFTPATTITGVHIDQTSQGQILLVAYGIKFIAYCEMDGEIAEVYADIHGSDKGEYTEKLLREHGKSFKWTILTVGTYLELQPAIIHLVVTPVNSVVIGWMYVIKKWIKEGILKKMMMWELDVIKKKFEVARDHHTDPHEMCKELLTGVDLLKEWEAGGGLENTLQMELSVLIKEVEEKIKSFKESSEWKALKRARKHK
jgi:hypothetical protein